MTFTFTVPAAVWEHYLETGRCAVVDETQDDGFRQINLAEWNAEVVKSSGNATVTLTEKGEGS